MRRTLRSGVGCTPVGVGQGATPIVEPSLGLNSFPSLCAFACLISQKLIFSFVTFGLNDHSVCECTRERARISWWEGP